MATTKAQAPGTRLPSVFDVELGFFPTGWPSEAAWTRAELKDQVLVGLSPHHRRVQALGQHDPERDLLALQRSRLLRRGGFVDRFGDERETAEAVSRPGRRVKILKGPGGLPQARLDHLQAIAMSFAEPGEDDVGRATSQRLPQESQGQQLRGKHDLPGELPKIFEVGGVFQLPEHPSHPTLAHPRTGQGTGVQKQFPLCLQLVEDGFDVDGRIRPQSVEETRIAIADRMGSVDQRRGGERFDRLLMFISCRAPGRS